MSPQFLRLRVRGLAGAAGTLTAVVATVVATVGPLSAALAVTPTAGAGAGAVAKATPEQAWQQECGSCHLAYPPQFLPAAAWKRVMAGLARHFGTDASLETDRQTLVQRWLLANAGEGGSGPADNRITHASWFRDEHGELPAVTFRRAAVKTASNCGACHAGAAQGDFDEHGVRVPR